MRGETSTQTAWTPTVSRTTRDWLETKKYWGEMSELKAEPTSSTTSGYRLLDRISPSESELKAEPNTITTSGYRLLDRERFELKARPTTTLLGRRLLDRSKAQLELKAEPTSAALGYRLLDRVTPHQSNEWLDYRAFNGSTPPGSLSNLNGSARQDLSFLLPRRQQRSLHQRPSQLSLHHLSQREIPSILLPNKRHQGFKIKQSQREIPRKLLTNNRRKIQISYHSDTSDGLPRATSNTGTKRLTNNSATTTLTSSFLLFRRGNL